MPRSGVRVLALVAVLATSRVAAQNLPPIRDWQTCTTIGGLYACASLSMWEESQVPGYPTGNYFGAGLNGLGGYPVGYRITAWGFYSPFPSDLVFDNYYGPSNWGSAPTEWTHGFPFATGAQDVDWALGGPQFSGEYFAGFYNGGDDVRNLRFAWRGLTDDGVTFDCLQAGNSEECVSPFSVNAASVAPEPSTWVLLLTGLSVLALLSRRRLAGNRAG